jgi:hypothetical protein
MLSLRLDLVRDSAASGGGGGGEKAESTKDDPFLGYDFAVLFPATEASKIGFRKVMRFWIC